MKEIYLVRLLDGTEHRGEYVGAKDGFFYLSDGDGVIRIEQALIRILAVKQVPSE